MKTNALIVSLIALSICSTVQGLHTRGFRKRVVSLTDTVYGLAAYPNQTIFYDYNPATALVSNVTVLAFNPDANLPVALDNYGSRLFVLGSYVNNATNALVTFDLDTGAMLYSPLYSGYNVTRLFYDQAYGLVGFMENPLLGKPLLARFNILAGYAEPIRTLPTVTAAALNVLNDSLWIVVDGTSIGSLDLSTGDIVASGAKFPASTFVSNFEFDPAGNAFLGVCQTASSSALDVCSLSLTTGNVTFLGVLPPGQTASLSTVSFDPIARRLFVATGTTAAELTFFEVDLTLNSLVNAVRNQFGWFSWNGNPAACEAFAECSGCAAAAVCEWCPDQGGCFAYNNNTCTSVISDPSFCPKADCSALTNCEDCLNSSGVCDWCLDSSECLPQPATGCPDRVNNQDMCPSKLSKAHV